MTQMNLFDFDSFEGKKGVAEMASYKLTTKHGHDFFEVSSMLQKSIRRSEFRLAGYAAYELYISGFDKYLWNRLLIISAEDCGGIITKEIVGLRLAYDSLRSNSSAKGQNEGRIFISKALVLLCMTIKNRDAAYFGCNFLHDANVDPSEIPHINEVEFEEEEKYSKMQIPSWVFDVHTLRGKMSGKTIWDMIREEQEALKPTKTGLFDDSGWEGYKARLAKYGK